jgi:excisionase family DNA binding protein
MENPFKTIEARLNNIETLLLDLKHQPKRTGSDEPQEKLLSVQEAAEFLHLTVPTVYSKVSRGELPVMKRSKRLYFSRDELVNYVKEGRRKTIAEIEKQELSDLMSKKGRKI